MGGAALYSSVFASQPSVIYQNTQPISTQADPVASSSGQAMTPEQLYAANVDACVGITVSTTMTNILRLYQHVGRLRFRLRHHRRRVHRHQLPRH